MEVLNFYIDTVMNTQYSEKASRHLQVLVEATITVHKGVLKDS